MLVQFTLKCVQPLIPLLRVSLSLVTLLIMVDALVLPQISPSASSVLLSDKVAYPYFLRMSPSELFQVNATIQLMKYFGWKKVGTIGKQNLLQENYYFPHPPGKYFNLLLGGLKKFFPHFFNHPPNFSNASPSDRLFLLPVHSFHICSASKIPRSNYSFLSISQRHNFR
jgi:hypothetical protein